MTNKIILILFYFLSAKIINAQHKDIDEYERIIKLPMSLLNLKSGKVIEGNEYGYHYHPDLNNRNEKQGAWIFKNDKQQILAIVWSGKDNRKIIEEQYKKGRIQTRIYYKSEYKYTEDPNLGDYILKYSKIIEFNKRGKVKKIWEF